MKQQSVNYNNYYHRDIKGTIFYALYRSIAIYMHHVHTHGMDIIYYEFLD